MGLASVPDGGQVSQQGYALLLLFSWCQTSSKGAVYSACFVSSCVWGGGIVLLSAQVLLYWRLSGVRYSEWESAEGPLVGSSVLSKLKVFLVTPP